MDEQAEPGEIEYGPTKYVNWEPEHLCVGVVCWCGTSIETEMSDDGEEETTIVTHRSMGQIIDAAVAEQTATLRAELAAARQALAQAEAERDEFKKQAIKGARGVYLDDRRRRTIRALVVAARAMWRALRAISNGRTKLQMILLGVKVNVFLLMEQGRAPAGEGVTTC